MNARVDLDQLKRRIAAITAAGLDLPEKAAATDIAPLAFGVPPIDEVLRRSGVPLAALHEVSGQGVDEEQGAGSATLLALALQAQRRRDWILWITQDDDLYAPGLAGLGLDLRRLVLVAARRDAEVCWALEEALRSRALGAVVGEIGAVTLTATRRLQLAAEQAGIPCFLLRRWRTGEMAARHRAQPIAAATRWRVSPLAPAGKAIGAELGPLSWRVDLWRCRNGQPASWVMEVGHDEHERITALPVAVADPLGDRPAPSAAVAAREILSAEIISVAGGRSDTAGTGGADRQPAGDPGRRSAGG